MNKVAVLPVPSSMHAAGETPRSRSTDNRRTFVFSPHIMCPIALLLSLSLLYLIYPELLLLQWKPTPRHIALRQPLPDKILFLKAVRASQIRHRKCCKHIRDPPKIAFLFLTNSDLTFAPLWDRFFRSANPSLFNVYIHADPSTPIQIPPSPWFSKQFIPAKGTCRGSPSLIVAERRLLARAILDDPANSLFALVSQHCIPLHPFDYAYNFLFHQNNPKSYIEIISKDPNLLERYNARGQNIMLPEVPFEKFRVGSQFFILAKNHALLVLRDRKLWRKFKLPCLNLDSCYPEEHYFPTLLSMEDPNGCSGFTLTHVNWTGSFDGHPHLYQPQEISNNLITTLRKSNFTYSYLFARKFAPSCLEPLMKLAEDAIFRD